MELEFLNISSAFCVFNLIVTLPPSKRAELITQLPFHPLAKRAISKCSTEFESSEICGFSLGTQAGFLLTRKVEHRVD